MADGLPSSVGKDQLNERKAWYGRIVIRKLRSSPHGKFEVAENIEQRIESLGGSGRGDPSEVLRAH
jgi:hypothetical protein